MEEHDDAKKPPAARTGIKRPRSNSAKSPLEIDNPDDNIQLVLTPHTLRLLKLVEEGTAEHAQLAAIQLSEIVAGSSPVVLWDILGRLQGYLTSPHWNTRHNASVAMEGVARQLPLVDQKDFLEHTAVLHRDQEEHSWLTVADLQEHLPTILAKGRMFLSASETRFDQLEESALEQLDQESKGSCDFVQRRIQFQRRILAQRLGLSPILSHVIGNEILQEDLLQDCQQTIKRPKVGKSTSRKGPEKEEKSIRALLVMEMQQQEAATPTMSSHRVVSHRNAQRLLATELVFRMFDAFWYVRHGSFMGILALLRAWRLQEASAFGIWPHDVLSRCLCVLALDRFADYSETATSDESGGIVAPVREMAGQVFSVVHHAAPESVQQQATEILATLAIQQDAESHSWELRHSALLALKYIFALQSSIRSGGTNGDWPLFRFQRSLEIGTCALADKSDDVRGAAAQLLVAMFGDEDYSVSYRQSDLVARIVKSLWGSLSPSILISSSVKDLVSLLSFLISWDFSFFMGHIAQSTNSPYTELFPKLQMLASCPYISVRTSVVVLIGKITTQLEDQMAKVRSSLDQQSRSELAASFCDIVQMVFGFHSDCAIMLGDGESMDNAKFSKACHETWTCLTRASSTILSGSDKIRAELEETMILSFFGLLATAPLQEARLTEASFGQRHRLKRIVSDALAALLLQLGSLERKYSHDLLEMCFRLCLDSPFLTHCENACLLLASMLGRRKSPQLIAMTQKCKDVLLAMLQEPPRCISVDRTKLQLSGLELLKILSSSLLSGVKMLVNETGTDKVVECISALWGEAIAKHASQRHHVDADLDSVRLSVVVAGVLVVGGADFLPSKLSPIVRSLMTSVQNELDHDCQVTTCERMVNLFVVLCEPATSQRQGAFQKTRTKILQNLCNMIKSNVEPCCNSASQVVSTLVSSLDAPLQSYEPIWETLSLLVEPGAVDSTDGLLVLAAICSDLCGNDDSTSVVVKTFAAPVASLCCVTKEELIQRLAIKCTGLIVEANSAAALEQILPTVVSSCKADDASVRDRACSLLVVIIEGREISLCPFVRSLLPLSMQLMTDPSMVTSKTAARIFSRLVQLAPLVKESISLKLFHDTWSDKADRVMDHLIHGKPLPPCEIYPVVNDALKASGVTLRPYQLEGVAWLRFLQIVNLNGALTDSMGLGKTLQALVGIALSHGDAEGDASPKSIVVCPSSVVGHWENEVHRFFPGGTVFRPYCIHGPRSKDDEPEGCNLVITSYAVLRSEIGQLCTTRWRYCVLDEGHLLKNPKTATAKAARRLYAQHKLILTGTPVQNKVNEVWATFDFLMPNFLGSSSEFSKEFAKPITKSQASGASANDIAVGMEKLKQLHQQVLPFILRREKDHVLKELPPKIISSIPCDMSAVQARLYDDFCSSNQGVRSLVKFREALQTSSTEAGIPSLGSDVLKALLYLRLVCTHPALVDPKGISAEQAARLDCSGKMIALKDILMQAGMSCHDMAAADNDTTLLYIDTDDGDSSKGDLQDTFDPSTFEETTFPSLSTSSGSKCLIFAQFTHSLDLVETFLDNQFPSTRYLRLDGKVPSEQRGKIVDLFNKDHDTKILLLTTRIGGLGLNLTAADTVIFLEHDWNPHADLQAMDRAHRIGQSKTVNVYKLVTRGSIEEQIMKLHEKKLAMSNAIVNSENSTLYSMGTDQLLDIFTFRSENSDPGNDDLDKTLDILVERYEDEYRSLSLKDFVGGFNRSQNF